MHTRMRTKILAALSPVIMALALVTITAGPASAHTPLASATCSTLTVSLTSYRAEETNTVTVTVDGTQVGSDMNFGSEFSLSYDFSDRTVAHTWQVDYVAGDDPGDEHGYTGSQSGTSTPCQVEDASAAVSLTDATCDTAQTITRGTTANTDWGEIVYSGTNNLDYRVTATAAGNHRFTNGDPGSDGKTMTFKGTLVAATVDCPAPPCLAKNAVSFTYDATTNSGVITVTAKRGHSNELCKQFWVTAASWTFDGNTMWPQTLDQWNPANSGGAIHTVGTYPYAAVVGCGQGDIYATFAAPGVTKPGTSPGTLTAPNTGYTEHFLHSMGFSGTTTPTYTVRDAAACHLIVVDSVPKVTFTDQCGTAHDGIVGGVDTKKINYTIKDKRDHGVGVETVTAVPQTGYVFAQGAYAGPWTHFFTNEDCPVVFGQPTVVDQVCSVVEDGLVDGNIGVDFSGNLANEISYQIRGGAYDFTATQATNILPPGDYTVTATAKSGYTLDPSMDSSWQLTILHAIKCTLITHPLISTTATSKDLTCASSGTYTLANTEGVVWYRVINGVNTLMTSGTYAVSNASTVKIHAEVADAGYGWEDGAQTDWTFNFTKSSGECLSTLAYTGSTGSNAGLLFAGGFLLIGGTVIAFERRFRTSTK